MLGKVRRGRLTSGAAPVKRVPLRQPPPATEAEPGWNHTARPPADLAAPAPQPAPNLRSSLLSLFSDPRVQWLTVDAAARALRAPRADVATTVEALLQSGELITHSDGSPRVRVPHAEKQRLESMFRDAALELGEHGVLTPTDDDALSFYNDPEEPRLPVTAGLLSLFLPGTGQLLNGDAGRASLVFAVWSLAWLTHLSPVWTFVCLYAGAEAFFTAKIRSIERKLAKEAVPASGPRPRALAEPKPQGG